MVGTAARTGLIAAGTGLVVAGAWLAVTDTLTAAGWPALLVAVVVAVVVAVTAGLKLAEDAPEQEGGVWEHIPSRQYDGRHVESGGLSRGEQEEAIDEIEEQAASNLDAVEDDR